MIIYLYAKMIFEIIYLFLGLSDPNALIVKGCIAIFYHKYLDVSPHISCLIHVDCIISDA